MDVGGGAEAGEAQSGGAGEGDGEVGHFLLNTAVKAWKGFCGSGAAREEKLVASDESGSAEGRVTGGKLSHNNPQHKLDRFAPNKLWCLAKVTQHKNCPRILGEKAEDKNRGA